MVVCIQIAGAIKPHYIILERLTSVCGIHTIMGGANVSFEVHLYFIGQLELLFEVQHVTMADKPY